MKRSILRVGTRQRLPRQYGGRRLARHAPAGAAIIAALLALTGCGSSGLLTSSLQAPTSAKPADPPPAMVAMRPLVGVPDAISEQLTRRLNEAATARNIALMVDPDAAAPRVLHGYFMIDSPKKPASKKPASKTQASKLVYIWDVVDPSGQRLGRVSGEVELAAAAGTAPADRWALVTPSLLQSVTDKALAAIDARPTAPVPPVVSVPDPAAR